MTISLEHGSQPFPFHARVAQYEFHSMDALKEKLRQFPRGTKSILSISPIESAANDQAIAELRTFLGSHGMALTGERRAN